MLIFPVREVSTFIRSLRRSLWSTVWRSTDLVGWVRVCFVRTETSCHEIPYPRPEPVTTKAWGIIASLGKERSVTHKRPLSLSLSDASSCWGLWMNVSSTEWRSEVFSRCLSRHHRKVQRRHLSLFKHTGYIFSVFLTIQMISSQSRRRESLGESLHLDCKVWLSQLWKLLWILPPEFQFQHLKD